MWSLKKDIQSLANNNNLPFLSIFDARDYKQTFKDSGFIKDLSKLKTWTQEGKHGDMSFLEANHEVRQDLSLILPNVKSVLMFLVPYALPKRLRRVKNAKGSQLDFEHAKKESLLDKSLIAKYAHAKDYHKVLKKRMTVFSQDLIKHIGREVDFRPVVDSVPFFERAHAREVGLGFIGKNTMLIKPGLGSYFFIASLFLSIEPEFIALKNNKTNPLHTLDCGQCQKCLHACPTGAIESPYSLNAKKCLSYMTIEHRGQVDEKYLTYFLIQYLVVIFVKMFVLITSLQTTLILSLNLKKRISIY